MADKESDQLHRIMHEAVPVEWDRRPMLLMSELRTFLKSIKDEGTSIDSGGGDGTGDLWVTVGGVEYYITARKSNAQLSREGLPFPPADQHHGDRRLDRRG